MPDHPEGIFEDIEYTLQARAPLIVIIARELHWHPITRECLYALLSVLSMLAPIPCVWWLSNYNTQPVIVRDISSLPFENPEIIPVGFGYLLIPYAALQLCRIIYWLIRRLAGYWQRISQRGKPCDKQPHTETPLPHS